MNKIYTDKESAINDLLKGEKVWKMLSAELRDDKDFIISIVDIAGKVSLKYNYSISNFLEGFLNSISDRLNKDKNLLLKLIKKSPFFLKHAQYEIVDDNEIVLEAINQYGMAIAHASDRLKNDRSFILHSLKTLQKTYCDNRHFFKDDLLQFNNDKEIALEAVKAMLNVFPHLSDTLKNDKDIVLAAIIKEEGSDCLEYASKKLRDNEEIFLAAFKKSNGYVNYFSDRLKKKYIKEIALSRIRNLNYFDSDNLFSILSSLTPKLKNDKEIFMMLVKKDLESFEYASNKLKNNKSFLLKLYKINPLLFKYASSELKDNEEFVLKTVKLDGSLLEYASDRLKDNEKVVLSAIKNKSLSLEYASIRLRNKKEIAIKAVTKNGNALEYVSEELKDNKDVFLAALSNQSNAVQYAPKSFVNDKEYAKKILKWNPSTFIYFPHLLKDDYEIVKMAIRQLPEVFFWVSDRLKNNKELVLMAMKYATNFELLSEDLRAEKELALIAYNAEHKNKNFFAPSLKKELSDNEIEDADNIKRYLELGILKQQLEKNLDKNSYKLKKHKV